MKNIFFFFSFICHGIMSRAAEILHSMASNDAENLQGLTSNAVEILHALTSNVAEILQGLTYNAAEILHTLTSSNSSNSAWYGVQCCRSSARNEVYEKMVIACRNEAKNIFVSREWWKKKPISNSKGAFQFASVNPRFFKSFRKAKFSKKLSAQKVS